MTPIFLMAVGFIIIFIALDIENDKIMYVLCAIGGILVLIGLLTFKPIETKAQSYVALQGYPQAGICKHMSITLEEAMEDFYPEVEIEDVDLLARLMTAEQGYNADPYDYYLTGSVVWNRMKSDYFPDTLREVIYQSGQYQCVENGHIEREWDEVAWEVAVEILEEGTNVPENVVFQAEFTQGNGVYESRGKTYYCYK